MSSFSEGNKFNFLDYITQEERIPEDKARKMFYQVLTAIEYCHKNFVVHRDLKVTLNKANFINI